jgi:hypothetical protein
MTLMPWQRANVHAALNYLKDIVRVGQNPQAHVLAQGLMEVLEPSRRNSNRRTASVVHAGPERRTGRDRRSGERRAW